MLFDVATDPHEERDLAPERRDILLEAVYRLNAWHDRMMMTMPGALDPLWTVMKEGGPYHARGRLSEYCGFLEKTGRGKAIPELKRRHPEEDAPRGR
jgi:hypothetical protein